MLLSVLAAASPAWAAPDFTRSEIRGSTESPRETDIVVFSLVIRNTGPDDAGSVYFMAEWPLMGFLVDAAGFDSAEVDHPSRRLTLTFPLAAGGERRFEVRVLAPRDSGGDQLTLTTRASHFDSGTEHWDHKSVTIHTRVSEAGVKVGGVRIAPAGLMTLAILGAGAVLWALFRRVAAQAAKRSGPGRATPALLATIASPGRAAAAITVAVGFWTIFGAMAWRDYQSLTTWRETRCTILGGRLSAQTTTRSRRGTNEYVDDTNYVPVLGLKYVVDGRETYSSGYDTGSRIGVGGRGGRTDELAQWTVVLRGFGGAYLFALFPLPVFLIGVAGIRALSRADYFGAAVIALSICSSAA